MTKICKMCRNSDMLCSGCSKLLSEGKISKTDISVSRALEKLGINAEFTRTFLYENRLIIIAGRDAGKIIGKSGRHAREISKILGTEVDVIEEGDERKMVEKMLRVPTVGINKVYGAAEKYRVRIEKRFRPRAHADAAFISKVLRKPVEIIFE